MFHPSTPSLLLLGLGSVAWISCGEEAPPLPSSSALTTGSSAPLPSGSAAPIDSTDLAEEDVKPVYPRTTDPPVPAAVKYCDLAYEVAERKRRECCPNVTFFPVRPTEECVRTLSYALRSGAVALRDEDLSACEAAITEAAKACDWGGDLPAACTGIFRGTRDERAECRSSLECKEGQFCAGLGVSKPGKCNPALPDGARCGGGVDSLASFIRQDPERVNGTCSGVCKVRSCGPRSKAGESCQSGAECAPGARCVQGKCVEADLPSAGSPCEEGRCAVGSRCVDKACVEELRIGEACADPAGCRSGHCEKGKCAMKCGLAIGQPSASPR